MWNASGKMQGKIQLSQRELLRSLHNSEKRTKYSLTRQASVVPKKSEQSPAKRVCEEKAEQQRERHGAASRKAGGGGERSGACDAAGQARKSARGMPWHWEPKKDVTSCDKPRGGANIHRSVDFRMGKPGGAIRRHPALNKIGVGREPPELKHLSRARKRHQPRFRE